MDSIDTRHHSPAIQSEIRRIAFRLKGRGFNQTAIAEILEVNRTTVSHWFRRASREGEEAVIASQRRGVRRGTGKRLTAEQEFTLRCLVTQHMPDELGIDSALWTRRAVMVLAKQTCQVSLPVRTMGNYLQSWGFTPQKPAKQAYEQQPDAVKQWLDEDYPALLERAKAEKAEVHWGDETGIRSRCQHGRSYAPAGKTPVQKMSGKHFGLNMISTLTNQGKVRFMLYEENLTANVMIRFLGRLIRGQKKKVFLILDNLRVHHANKVKEWVGKRPGRIELFFLPSYSPELNPDEYLNCDLKALVHSGAPARDKKQLKKQTSRAMRLLQKRPGRIRKYFKHPKIAYAA